MPRQGAQVLSPVYTENSLQAGVPPAKRPLFIFLWTCWVYGAVWRLKCEISALQIQTTCPNLIRSKHIKYVFIVSLGVSQWHLILWLFPSIKFIAYISLERLRTFRSYISILIQLETLHCIICLIVFYSNIHTFLKTGLPSNSLSWNVPDNSLKNLAIDPSFQLARPQVGQDVFWKLSCCCGQNISVFGFKI